MSISINGTTGISGVDGDATTPALQGGDVNTGVYFPAADQVAISTNGTGRLFVDSSGRVGVGTTSPATTFVVDKSDASGLSAHILVNNSESSSGISLLGAGSTFSSPGWPSQTDCAIIRASAGSSNGLAIQAPAGSIAFWGASSERLRITSDGKVGIGTTSPGTYKLNISGAYNEDGLRVFAGASGYGHPLIVGRATGGEALRVDNGGRLLVGTSNAISGSNANDNLQLVNVAGSILSVASSDTTIGNGTRIGEVQFWGQPGSTWGNFATIGCFGDALAAPGDNPGRLVFSTTADGASSPTERMRISAFGGLDSYANGDTFTVRNAGSSPTNSAFQYFKSATSTSDGTIAMAILQDGDLENTNNSYGAISDIKLKENVVDAASQWDDLKAIQVRKYNFKPETGHSTHTQIGLIAQEVELVSPGLVGETVNEETGESTKSVNYSVLYMKAVKALQEAMERIETLEAEVQALKGGN